MAGLSAEEKQRVRDLAAQWLEVEEQWQKTYCMRASLTLVLLPLYFLHELLFATVTIIIVLFACVFACFFCFVACFRLDPLLRCIIRKLRCNAGLEKQQKEKEEAEAKRQQIIAAGGDLGEEKLRDDFEEACLTRYQRKMFQEKLWVRLVLFSPGRSLIAKRLEEIRKKSEEFLQQRSRYTYVIPKDTVLKLNSWPKHEQAVAQGLLAKTEIAKIKAPQTGARIFAPVLFVSHKWAGNQCDTDKNEILQQVKKRLELTPKSYVWFDYACVPQDDAEERMMHLRSIPDIVSRCEVGIFLHETDPDLAEKYMKSIWCQMEFVLSGLNMKNQKERDWTIFDCNDLYLILPAFIEMTCRAQNFAEMFGDVKTTGGHAVFKQILRFFIKWHDETTKLATAADSPV